MAVIPLLLSLAEDLNGFDSWGHEDDFGLGVYPHELRRYQRLPSRLSLLSPRGRNNPYGLARKGHDQVKTRAEPTAAVGKDGFQVCMDVQQFKPSEITVKTVDRTIVVEGKHEEREDSHGFISRHFVRKYSLPKDYDPDAVVSTLSSDGILTVRAPPPVKSSGAERVVQIQQTGPAHLSVKDSAEPKEAAAKEAAQDAVGNGEKANEKMED